MANAKPIGQSAPATASDVAERDAMNAALQQIAPVKVDDEDLQKVIDDAQKSGKSVTAFRNMVRVDN